MTIKAQRAAQRILKSVGYSIPVDIKKIIESHKISIRSQPMEDNMSSMLVIKDGRAVIGVNQAHSSTRQRFSLAHELGHFLLHSKSTRVFLDASTIFFRDELASEGSDIEEIEANNFAAELLMPASALRQIIRQQSLDAFDERAVQRLAAQFEVSVQALTIRLTRLNLISA
jgi:Zn-dependent peptidase ImmA (M78 family)